MRFDRKKFFDGFRLHLDPTIEQEQVDGLEFLLGEFESEPLWKDIRHIAYALATVFHETAGSFQPVVEGYYLAKTEPPDYAGKTKRVRAFQKTLRYYPYFGRGYVQLTWKSNYEKAGKAIGVDLVSDPDKALEPKIAFQALSFGLFRGWYGAKLTTHINANKTDYVNARRSVNVLDKAGLIAGYARQFEKILRASAADDPATPAPNPATTTFEHATNNPALPTEAPLPIESEQPVEPPPVVKPQDEVTKTEKTTSGTGETATTTVVTKNEQDVNEPAQVSTTQYQGVGFIGALKKDFAVVGGGNLSFQSLQEYAVQASGWPPWVISIITKLATIAIIIGAGWLLYRLVHYFIWKVGDWQRMKVEAEINSNVTRKNIEWT